MMQLSLFSGRSRNRLNNGGARFSSSPISSPNSLTISHLPCRSIECYDDSSNDSNEEARDDDDDDDIEKSSSNADASRTSKKSSIHKNLLANSISQKSIVRALGAQYIIAKCLSMTSRRYQEAIMIKVIA